VGVAVGEGTGVGVWVGSGDAVGVVVAVDVFVGVGGSKVGVAADGEVFWQAARNRKVMRKKIRFIKTIGDDGDFSTDTLMIQWI
jgi:hypothetical protein